MGIGVDMVIAERAAGTRASVPTWAACLSGLR